MSRWRCLIVKGCVFGILVLGRSPARAQFFSPGPLANVHRTIEGLENCLRCHSEQRALLPKLCLDCHQELGPSLRAHDGFHGRLPLARLNACQDCHPDHRGRDVSLIDWQGARDRFDHRRTGWTLEGKHASTRCEGCHQRALIAAPAILQLLRGAPARATYLGLPPRCSGCHFDEHRGQLGDQCQSCHTPSAWVPAPGFHHDRTTFPLRGKHIQVACGKCHPRAEDDDDRGRGRGALKPVASSYLELKPIDHRTCGSCHDDPHQGKLGPRCANCHTEVGWRVVAIKGNVDPAFHDETRFPLQGSHIGVACRSCHGPFPGQPARYRNIAFSRCDDCHEDAHLGQLAPAAVKRSGDSPPARGADCSSCHTVDGFTPPRFEAEQHGATAFPLEGAHALSACRGCHPNDDRLAARVPAAVRRRLQIQKRPLEISVAVLRPHERPGDCSSCHADPHGGQFAAASGQTDCGRCHGTGSFRVLAFDHSRQTRFPLAGSHAALACSSCHRDGASAPGAQAITPTELGASPRGRRGRSEERSPASFAGVRYKPLPLACAGCHADEHQGQFDRVAARGGRDGRPPARSGGGAADCALCHTPSRFDETLFSHADPRFTAFALRGRHATVPCNGCHQPVEVAPGVRAVWYRGVPTSCGGCHVDFHRGDFRGLEP